ncbi:MAG TPA: XdhC/CoxI family protein [bacterium]|nr:XdhC/CoxI family protein [bacterium]
MRELRDILDRLVALRARGEKAAIATVVRVRGSTYRREGARLLILPDGRTEGSISGGCLEGDVAEIASEVLATGQPRLVNYDLTSDDEAVWGLGLGCNGAIDVFVEAVADARADEAVALLRDSMEHRRAIVLVTVLTAAPGGPAPGARVCVPADGEVRGTLGGGLDARAVAAARRHLAAGRSAVLSLQAPGGAAEVFVEVVTPPLPLLICGAGHDVLPVVRLAHQLGWWVMVADSRPAYATRDRFPDADEVVLADDAEVASKVRIDRDTFVVLMTHNYLHDLALLRGLLATPARYIGLLGPRRRTERLLSDLAKEGVALDDTGRARLFAPVGLDLGAESPEEIALSVLAEVLAARNGRNALRLRDRQGPIHLSTAEPEAPVGAPVPARNVVVCQD